MACKSASSGARAFVQVAIQRSAAPPRLLDMLLPPSTVRYLSRGISSSARRTWVARPPSSSGTHHHRSARHGAIGAQPSCRGLRRSPALDASLHWRSFSGTPARRETRTLHNPQVDEDGNPMSLEITPRAAKRLSDIMAKDGNPHLALRIQVESGGCHGFQYLMRLITLPPTLAAGSPPPQPPPMSPPPPPPSTTTTTTTAAAAAAAATATSTSSSSPPQQQQQQQPVIGEDDTIFYFADSATADPLAAPKIILDQPSLELLKGSKVDFTMELIGSQFKIVDNPLATSSCGCGTSFDVKI